MTKRMRNILLALAMLLALALAGCPRGDKESAKAGSAPATVPGSEKSGAVLEKVRPALVLVHATFYVPSGTATERSVGFLISDDGHVMTDAGVVTAARNVSGTDVVATSRSVEVTLAPGTEQERIFGATVERENPTLGVATLKIDGPTPEYLATVLADGVKDGDTVFACGYAATTGMASVQATRLAGRRETAGAALFELETPTQASAAGGPLVTEEGKLIGVLTAVAAEESDQQLAATSDAVTEWLASDAAASPEPPQPGAGVKALLDEAGLGYDESRDGVFVVPYDNEVQVSVHQHEDYMRVFVPLGDYDPETGLRAMVYNYYDPVGKLSVHTRDDRGVITWEAQVPLRYASAGYLKFIADVAAGHVVRWHNFLEGNEPEDWYDMYPGGDKEQLRDELRTIVKAAVGDDYEETEKSFKISRDGVDLWVQPACAGTGTTRWGG
jgi:S1-C subfamily serine protease